MKLLIEFFANRVRSIAYAIEGWHYVLKHEKNAWVHAFASLCVLLVGLWLEIGRLEWALLIIMVTLVWLAEFINTAIEAVVDLASPAHHPLAKMGKDIGAAGVLIAACAAVLVGIIILGPLFLQKIQQLIGE